MPLVSRHRKTSASQSRSRRGIFHTTINVPEIDYAQFKAFCASCRTTISAEFRAFIRNQISEPDILLSAALYVPLSPDLKKELTDYAEAHNLTITDLLIEAFGLLQRRREPLRVADLVPDAGNYHRRYRSDCEVVF